MTLSADIKGRKHGHSTYKSMQDAISENQTMQKELRKWLSQKDTKLIQKGLVKVTKIVANATKLKNLAKAHAKE